MTSPTDEQNSEPAAPAQAIGRPGPWQDSRGQQDGHPIRQSVTRKPKEGPPDTTSTPVTRRDYEFGK